MSTLEILTGIVFLLAGLTVFYVYSAIKIAKQHNTIVDAYERLNNEYKRQINSFDMNIEDIKQEILQVNQQMKADSYAGISEVNKKLENIDKEMKAFIHKSNLQDDVVDKTLKQNINHLSNLAQQIRVLRENPNMTSQY